VERYEGRVPLVLDDVDPDLVAAFSNKFDPQRVEKNAFKADDDIMFFVHIPKTAGTSLGRTLKDNYDVFRPVKWDNINPTFQAAVEIAYADRTVGRQAIIGHYSWHQINSVRARDLPVQAGAFVRDPVARLTSNYDYNSSPAHPARDRFMKRFPSFEAYCDSVRPNFQCWLLAGGNRSLETVLKTLVDHYTFLGVTEAFDASLEHLGASHGFDKLAVFDSNRAPSGAPRTHVSPSVRTMLYDRHADDLRLVRMLKGFYGVS